MTLLTTPRDISPCPGKAATVLVNISIIRLHIDLCCGPVSCMFYPHLCPCLLYSQWDTLFGPGPSSPLSMSGAADGPVAAPSSAHCGQTLWDGACRWGHGLHWDQPQLPAHPLQEQPCFTLTPAAPQCPTQCVLGSSPAGARRKTCPEALAHGCAGMLGLCSCSRSRTEGTAFSPLA